MLYSRANRCSRTLRSGLWWLATCVLALYSCGAALADVLELTAGSSFEGEIELTSVRLSAPTGAIEIPRSAIRRMVKTEGRAFSVVLTDGSAVTGEVIGLTELRIATGLVVQVVPLESVSRVAFGPLGFTLEDLRSGFYRVDNYRGDRGIEACPLRIAFDARPYLAGTMYYVPRIQLFECGGLALGNLAIKVRQVEGLAEIELDTSILMRKTDDKWAVIHASLESGGEFVGGLITPRVDAEEGKLTRVKPLRITLSRSLLEKAVESPAPLLIAIEVKVSENRTYGKGGA